MPVDVDAYMNNLVPSLSRGGSWLPAEQPGPVAGSSMISGRNVFSQGGIPSPPLSPALSQASPFFALPFAASSMVQTPVQGPLTHAPTPTIFNLQLPPPPAATGWARSQAALRQPSVSGVFPAVAASGVVPQPHQAAPTVLAPSVRPHQPVSPSVDSGGRFRDGSFVWEGGSWEHDSGAPKQLSRESDYLAPKLEHAVRGKKKSIPFAPHRRRADSLPSPPSESRLNALNPLPPRHSHAPRSQLSGVWEDERERTSSGSGKRLEARRAVVRRPRLSRSHSHDQLNKIEEGHVAPSAPAPKRDRAADHAKRSPSSRQSQSRRVPSINTEVAHILDNGREVPSLPEPNSPYRKLGHTPRSPSGGVSADPKSPYVKLSRPPPLRRHTHQIVPPRSRLASSPVLGHESSSSSSSGSDHRQRPSPSMPSTPRDVARYDLRSLADALPTAPQHKQAPMSNRSRLENFGYVPPLSDDGYDRYTAHPAAPTPGRTEHEAPTTASGSSVPPGGQVVCTEYLPVGYARPTREVAWNRDGPAMKTHGVAWKKHTEGLVLPPGPAGPRWDQARPPRVETVTGGGWWESGGQGH